jgi:hypothetical protein
MSAKRALGARDVNSMTTSSAAIQFSRQLAGGRVPDLLKGCLDLG